VQYIPRVDIRKSHVLREAISRGFTFVIKNIIQVPSTTGIIHVLVRRLNTTTQNVFINRMAFRHFSMYPCLPLFIYR
jgi:hypothetical protein